MKKRIVWVLVVLVAAGAGVYALRGRNNQPNNRIVVSGNIELTEVNIGFKTAGRLIERNSRRRRRREERADCGAARSGPVGGAARSRDSGDGVGGIATGAGADLLEGESDHGLCGEGLQ